MTNEETQEKKNSVGETISGKDGQAEYVDVSKSVKDAVDEAMYLVRFIAHQGVITIKKEYLESIIESKFLVEKNRWTKEAEVNFWVAYDGVTTQIKPVNIKSLKACLPDPDSDIIKSANKTKASGAVKRYMFLTIFFMILLLCAQIYWVVGSDLHKELGEIFEKRNSVQLSYDRMRGSKNEVEVEKDVNIQETKANLDLLNQQLDSNYELLCSWNSVWRTILFKEPFEGKLTRYVGLKNRQRINRLEHDLAATDEKWLNYVVEMKRKKESLYRNNIKSNKKDDYKTDKEIKVNELVADTEFEIDSLKEYSKRARSAGTRTQQNEEKPKSILLQIRLEELQNELDVARNRLFLNFQSAGFVLRSFHVYFLPLLYGLLGASTFVLRKLSMEIRTLTYSKDSESRFILRLSLGALGGMSIGWFFKPDTLTMYNSISPMAMAFLVGYNVDLLFAIMDKFVSALTDQIKGIGAEEKKEDVVEEKK